MKLHTCKDGGEILLGGLGIRPVVLPNAGDTVDGHKHNFAHVMFFASGSARLNATGPNGETESVTVHTGTFFLMRAEWMHAVEALTDNVKFWCVFPEYDASGQRPEHFMGDIP